MLKRKKYKSAKKYMEKALRRIDGLIYGAFKDKYFAKANKIFGINNIFPQKEKCYEVTVPSVPEKARRNMPVILAIDKDQNIEKALINALQPDPINLRKLVKTFRDPFIWKKVLKRKYSKKRGKMISYWKWKKIKIDFKEGIYLIKLNKKMHIIYAKRVSQVLLDPQKYQNQQYLKNSYFAL